MPNSSYLPARLFNRLRLVLDRRLTAANALDRACQSHPDSAVFHLDEPSAFDRFTGRDISPRQLLDFCNRAGNALLAAGMKRHDRVAICQTNSLDYFFLALAIIRAGGIAVPIHGGMELASLRHYLEYTGAKFLCTDAAQFRRAIGNPDALPTFDAWVFPIVPDEFSARGINLNRAVESASANLTPVSLSRDSDVLIVHTSGTTGFPKGVISTSGSLIRAVKGHYLDEPISARNRIALAGHFNHLVCYVGLYTALLGNFPLWSLGRFDPQAALELIDRERINIFFGFPDVYLGLLDTGLERYDLSSMRVWIATADASHEAHMQEFCRRGAYLRVGGKRLLGSVFVEALGTSEVGAGALVRYRFASSRLRFRRTIGRPTFGGPRAKVADEQGRRVATGAVGRLLVKGPTLFKGYWNAHDRLHGVMHDGWWWTGDLAYRDRWGRFHHVDRAADAVQGAQGVVYTLPVEEVVLSHPDVREAVVIGLPHPQAGAAPVALVYGKPGREIDPEECRGWVNARLEPHAALQAVLVVKPQDLPRGLTGKILKRVLRERLANFFVQDEKSKAHDLDFDQEVEIAASSG